MKVFISKLPLVYRKAGTLLFIAAVSLVLISCSAARNEDSDTTISDNENDKSYVFTEDGSEWKVRLQDDKITELYINGTRIADKDIKQYENKVNNKIEKFESDMADFEVNMAMFHKDMESCKEDFSEIQNEMNIHGAEITFDSEQFKKDMEKVSSEMQQVFASADFKAGMEELKNNLQNINVDINMDEVNEQLKQAKEQMSNIDININLSELKEEMASLKEELKSMKVQIKDANKNVNKFNSFMSDLKSEMEKDGVIEDSEDDIDMIFNSKEMIIDGDKVSDELHNKYKMMYEKRFGKMNDETNINTNE
jgi:chromosome segregation ATPase